MSSTTTTGEKVYHPKDAVASSIKTTLLTGGVGIFASAVQNTLEKRNVGPWGVITRSGGTIAVFAAMGGTYEFVKTASANLREKEDHWNVTWGGLFSGSILGLRARSFPAVFGYGFALAALLGAYEYTGGSLSGYEKDLNVDEFERREKLRKRYRSPGEDTIAELGEGRGIYGPGYEERRRERLKQTYGWDVPATQPSASPS